MNGGKKTYRKVKKYAKAQGRADKKVAKQTGKTLKRAGKTVAKGEKQRSKAIKQQSKGVSRGGTPRTGPRKKMDDANVKIASGTAAQKNPTPKRKIKKKAYRTKENVNYQGGRTGQKKYLTYKGKQTNRRGGRPKS